MAEIKPFLKKYEKVIVAIVTLIFVYLTIVFNQKINFLLGNELIVYLEQDQKYLSMNYGNSSEIRFEIRTDNSANCRAACNYSFNDRSRNEVLDEGLFEIAKNEQVSKKYSLSAKRLGSGQDYYSFDLTCHSLSSLICLTSGPQKSRSALVIVNYELTDSEKEIKKTLKKNATDLLESLAEADALHQKASQKYFELSLSVNLKNLAGEKISIDDEYDKIRISIENLKSLWEFENYFKFSQLFNRSYFESLSRVKKDIGIFDKSINNIVGVHNGFLKKLQNISGILNESAFIANAVGDNETPKIISANIHKFNNASNSVTSNKFDSYESVNEAIINITSLQAQVISKTMLPSSSMFFETEYSLNYENDLLCSLKQDCGKNFSAAGMIEKTEEFLNDYPDSANLRQNCGSLSALKDEYSVIRNKNLNIIIGKNITFRQNEWLLNLSDNFNDNLIRKINNSYFNSIEKLRMENKTNDIIKIAENLLPNNEVGYTELNYDNSTNISLYLLSKINLSNRALNAIEKCSKLKQAAEIIGSFDFKPVSLNVSYKIVLGINTNLSDNPPICCVFNDCKPCCNEDSCRNDQKRFPVIFIHGHSFAKDNSPEFSLDAFDKLQSKLQEDGYLNAGIISLYSKNEPVQEGIWEISGKPVTVKISYYYDAFRKDDKYILIPTKSENIDTYAVRLKDLIDIIKERTSAPKVNIIAHSMGGLVARRYMQIFGSQNVNKFIMIGTPNHGISISAGNYCGLAGENRECNDMLQDSLFINKLNDPSDQPADAKMFSIIGQGCKTDGKDGDGVVTTESAKMENAKLFYVNGTCEGYFGSILHTDLLDIGQYPQVYKDVFGILKG